MIMKISCLNLFSKWQNKLVAEIKNDSLIKTIQVIDLKTLQRYKKESMQSIAEKALYVFLLNPIVTFLRITFSFVQMAFDFFIVSVDSSVEMFKAIKKRKIIKIFEIYVISRINFVKYIAEDTIDIKKSLFCSFRMQLDSLFAIFHPLDGRKIVANLERNWNNNKNIEDDLKNKIRKDPIYKVLWKILLKREEIVYYLASDFQPLGGFKR